MVLYRTSTQFCAWNLYFRGEKLVVAEKFIRSLVSKYGKHIVYTDGGTWYHETCSVIGIETLFTFAI
jgi:hypothetical protein